MKRLVFFIITTFCIWINLLGQTQEHLEYVFLELKELDFASARKHTADLHPAWLKNTIIEIVEYQADPEHRFVFKTRDSFASTTERFIYELSRGYNELSTRKYGNQQAFTYFLRALQEAQDLDNPILEKSVLIIILNQLKNQIYIGSNQFSSYLDRFAYLANDINDRIILELDRAILYSKANDTLGYDVEQYKQSMARMDSLFSVVDMDNGYVPFYYHEKGIENKFDGNYEKARYFFNQVDSITANKPEYRSLRANNYWQLADMSILAGDYGKADHYWERSKAHAISLRDTFYDNRLAARLKKGIGDYNSAYHYLDMSNKNEYELSAKTYAFMSNQLSRKFEEESKVKHETVEKEKQLLIEQQKVRANRNWLIAAGIAFILGTGIAVLIQKNTRKRRLLAEQNALLKQQRLDNLLKNQELMSIDAMIAGQEKERQKVAGELHDDLGSMMATIKLHFDNSKVSKKDPALQNAGKLLDEAYQKIRNLAHGKNSGVMSDQGLLPAVKKMAKNITETNALEVSVEDFGLGERMENSLELSIFRIIQELVANAIKHGEASKINVQLTQHEDNLNIIVEDNGKGFDRSKITSDTKGMGLMNIEKRVEHLEGSFTIDSIVGRGTSIIIDIPV